MSSEPVLVEKQQPWDFHFVKSALDEINQLSEVESLEDPEEFPFRSKYAARELLEDLKKKLNAFLDSDPHFVDAINEAAAVVASSSADPRDHGESQSQQTRVEIVTPEDIHFDDNIDGESTVDAKLSPSEEPFLTQSNNSNSSISQFSDLSNVDIFLKYVEAKLGLNFIECEETSSGEEHLTCALNNLTARYETSSPSTAFVHMYLLNHLGILQAARRENEKAATFLHQSEATYETYKAKHSAAPLFPTDLLSSFKGRPTSIICLRFCFKVK